MKYPTYVKNCIELLEASGHSAYAVGGAVRDSLLGKEPSDWDVTTSAKPEETLEIFKEFRTIPTGIKHGTITVLFDYNGVLQPIEITTFRVDGEYRDSRHPESVEFSSDVRDDLSRRDFTVNAMAFNEKEGIIDAFDGQNDLKKRIIRAVGDPQKRFSEDALRILRAFRFCAQLNFEISPKTLSGAATCAPFLKNIARERVGVEFKKLIRSPRASYSLKKMIEFGIWQELFETPAPDFQTVLKISELKNGSFSTRIASLISDYSEVQQDVFLTSLRLSNDEKRLILRLLRVKNFEIPQKSDKFSKSARQFLHLYNNVYDEAVEMLQHWNGKQETQNYVKILEFERSQNNPLSISDLKIKGNDILPLCNGDYSKVGKALEAILEMVLENPDLNEKDKLIEIAKKNFF